MACIAPSQFELDHGGRLIVRSAEPEDARALIAFRRKVLSEGRYFATEIDEFDPPVDNEEARLVAMGRRDGNLEVVASDGASVLGWIRFCNRPERRMAHTGFLDLAVAAAWRGRGLGTRLLQRVLVWASREPLVERINLTVYAENERALHLYLRAGFSEDGRRRREVKLGPGKYADVVLMSRFTDV